MAKYGQFLIEGATEDNDIRVTYSDDTYTDEALRAEHWFPVVETMEPSDSPYKVFHYTLVNDENGGYIEETYTIEQPDLPPAQYSKLKILLAAQQAGFIEQLVQFLNADPTTKMIWDASNTIEDNELLANYLPAIAQALGKTEDEVKAFLNANCAVD